MSRIPVAVRAVVLAAALLVIPCSLACASTFGQRTLHVGMHGHDVRTLQADLGRLGFSTTVDGAFGPATGRSVRRLQRADKLPVTGVVAPALADRIVTAVEGEPVAHPDPGGLGHRALRQGMHGRDVRALQRALAAAGFATGVDGQFGPATAAALRRYQRSAGLRATGVLTRPEARRLLAAHITTATATTPVPTASIGSDGQLTLPAGAPAEVQEIVDAANSIIDTHYVYGGGHDSFVSQGYDCSGAVSVALHGAALLSSPEVSGQLESFGDPGPGQWVTVYANANHVFLDVAGRAFDTADYGGPDIPGGSGPRWRSDPTGNLGDGADFTVRHPPGL